MLAMLIAVSVLVSCQKDQYETASGPVLSSKYTTLTLDDNFDLPNPATSEQYAVKLFDLKEDAGGLTEKELLSIGDPARNEDLLYALLFVEKYNRDEILWSWQEPKDGDPEDRSPEGQWKWTGGNPIASMYASGFKKWPAYKVKNRFQDPCGEVIQAGPVYQECYKLCDADLPSPCMSEELKKEILEKIIADTPVDPYSIAKQLVQQSNWPFQANVNLPSTPVTLMNYERQVISGDIVHYKFEVAVGSHDLDRIGIHRVVKETAPNKPIVTDKAVFFQHGSAKDFAGMALPGLYSPNMSDDFGIAYFMAENDVDFWGIDQAWTLVPESVTDLDFMATWGIEKNFTDLRTGLAIARIARFLTSDVLGKLNLSGYSSGVTTSFAGLDHETQIEEVVRHAKGFIAIDMATKSDNEVFNDAWNDYMVYYQGLFNSGVYQDNIIFKLVGNLARTDPNGDSPLIPGFTNKQTALYFGAVPAFGGTSFHYIAGIFDNDMAVDMQYVTLDQWYDFLESAVAYEPLLLTLDQGVLVTGVGASDFDNHLGEIKIPIYNISPGGGFAEMSESVFPHLGSTDVTSYIPRLHPPDQAEIDFAHIDIFIAHNAETVMWKPMLDWIKAH